MTVKLIVSITDLKEGGIDFNFTFEDENQKSDLERNIAEHMAAECLNGMNKLGSAVIEDDDDC